MIRKDKYRYAIAILALIILIIDLIETDFQNFKMTDIFNPLAMISIVLAMYLSLKNSKSDKN